jgi:putative hydrolase of HD superfamily
LIGDRATAILDALRLKGVQRAGWLRVGVQAPESVAAHSWGMSWLVLAVLPEQLDLQRALTYAALHDLAEVRVGDITPYDGVPRAEKHRREDEAMIAMLSPLGARGEQLLAQWRAYEAQNDPEAEFVRQLDRLEMALQALLYREYGHETDEFVRSARQALKDADLIRLLDDLVGQ